MSSNAVAISTVAGGGTIAAVADLRTRRVPNEVSLGIAAIGIALAATHVTNVPVASAVGGLAVGLVLMLPGHVIGATGAGDVKLFAAVATLLGPTRTVAAFAYTAILGAALALVVAVNRRRLHETLQQTATLVMTGGANVPEIEQPAANNRFAYAPAIALGALAAAMGF
jgi:prepilin peptidase CpaA